MREMEIQRVVNFFYEEESKYLTKKYLEKYLLTQKEWLDKWLSLKTKIFNKNINSNKNTFNKEFRTIIRYDENPFTKENFLKFQQKILSLGEIEFVIIEDEVNRPIFDSEDLPVLKLKYPSSIQWEQLNNDNVEKYEISKEIFQDMYRNFFIFGRSGTWGVYIATENDIPFTMIGFQYKDIN